MRKPVKIGSQPQVQPSTEQNAAGINISKPTGEQGESATPLRAKPTIPGQGAGVPTAKPISLAQNDDAQPTIQKPTVKLMSDADAKPTIDQSAPKTISPGGGSVKLAVPSSNSGPSLAANSEAKPPTATSKKIIPGGGSVKLASQSGLSTDSASLKKPIVPPAAQGAIPSTVSLASNKPARPNVQVTSVELEEQSALQRLAHETSGIKLSTDVVDHAATISQGGIGADPKLEALQKHIYDTETELKVGEILMEAGLITDEQYAEVETRIKKRKPINKRVFSRNLLVELHKVDGVNVFAIISYMVEHSSVPYVDLANFDFGPYIDEALPLDVCENLGILPFGENPNSMQIGCVNPFDMGMQELIEAQLPEKKLFFYQIHPEQFIKFYDKNRK